MALPSSKLCIACGNEFNKRMRDSSKQWESRAFCSILCANRTKQEQKRVEISIRFERYIEKIPLVGCWIWTGSQDDKSYGQISTGNKLSPLKAHRFSYEIEYGPIPNGLVVRHRCDIPSCVNPHHLEIGTQKENINDMMKRGRFNSSVLKNLLRVNKLSEDQKEQIKRLVYYGISKNEIARLFEVTRKAIFNYSKEESI